MCLGTVEFSKVRKGKFSVVNMFNDLCCFEDRRRLKREIDLFVKRHFFKPLATIGIICRENSEFCLFFIVEDILEEELF